MNRGTKHLNQFLECTKVRRLDSDCSVSECRSELTRQEYESTGLLGASTNTYDSEGEILSTAPWEHVTREAVEKVLDRFRGDIQQVPPMCVPS